MNPHYYIMKNKKILRLEAETPFDSLPENIQKNVLILDDIHSLDQNQANWRVVIFRDEILDLEEYVEWLETPEASQEEDCLYDIAK